MNNLTALQLQLRQMDRVLLGYSGGVDSALLAVVGTQVLGPGDFLAVIGRSDSYPQVQLEVARQIASEYQVRLVEVATQELSDADYITNSMDRCYFCKRELWDQLWKLAEANGFSTVIDGTHAEDLLEHRPGRRAGIERQIRSPFAELGWTKATIRSLARELGLPIWDAPAAPCLSSRIKYGVTVTAARLRQVELAESALRRLGITGDLRVRHLGDEASIEVSPHEFQMLEDNWDLITGGLEALGFLKVSRNPRGYRRGAMLELVDAVADSESSR